MIPVILMLLFVVSLNAQTPFDPDYGDEASQIREHLYVFTDRDIYAVDELIHFAMDQRVTGPTGGIPWSNVLYVELIDPGGEALVRGKYRISGGLAEGSMHVPADLLTGNYHLKCYTRWMRNFGPGTFTYIPLKIINPFRSEVVDAGTLADQSDPAQRIRYKAGLLECYAESESFRPGQEVQIQLKVAPDTFLDQARCYISVVPAGALDLESGQVKLAEPDPDPSFRVEMLPDLGDHVTISGTVMGPEQEPVPYKTLHFSLLGEVPDYFAALTDIHGRFVISTPTGHGEYKEFFVTPEQENGGGLEVRIDQEYDSRTYEFPKEEFQLSGMEKEVARRIALNMQLSKVYNSEVSATQNARRRAYSEADRIPFYGTEVKRLQIDDYVMLPNLEEIFINLMPELQIYRKQGKKKIRILSDNNSIGVYHPLIMIDHISIFDHEALLALSPEKIERIDLIDDIYLKGSVPFGGVLAIHSRKGDMAGIDLPVGSYFFDYQTFNADLPVIDPLPVLKEREPDTRNTLLWATDKILIQGEPLQITFRAPKSTGHYVVLVRALSPDGEVITASYEFTVK